MKTYKSALIGVSRMGAFIDNEGSTPKLPTSHAAAYEASDRTEIVACSDLRVDVMEQFGKRYGVAKEHQYVDYKEMVEREKPDIVSVATQPEPRSEIVVYLAEHGIKAIYAEKAMAASTREADAMVEAVERNGVVFNLGTNRRWDPGFDTMKELIDSGTIGDLKTIIIYDNGTLFNMSSHWFDIMLRLNNDRPVSWVQAHLQDGADFLDGDLLPEDPSGHGIIQFEDGVTGYALLTGRQSEVEAICERGVVTALGSGQWKVSGPGPMDHRGKHSPVPLEFPAFEPRSSSVALVEDLANSLDSGEPTRGGVRVARAVLDLIFAFIESHRRGGARVTLPLTDSNVRLQRDRAPRPPTYERLTD